MCNHLVIEFHQGKHRQEEVEGGKERAKPSSMKALSIEMSSVRGLEARFLILRKSQLSYFLVYSSLRITKTKTICTLQCEQRQSV